MCGIAGIVRSTPAVAPDRKIAERMLARLRHRGPDDEGCFISDDGNASLVHTRLSILDLSEAGHQPMLSANGRFVIVFNGEIYNFRELRETLAADGVRFRSQTDTEVILEAFTTYGSRCVKLLQGMFAFAIWDTRDQSLFLARDPLGIKPLYVWCDEGSIAFASELRAVLESDLTPRRLNSAALFDYLRLGSVREPETLVQGVHMLAAGHHMVWKDGCAKSGPFWQLRFAGDDSPSRVIVAAEAVRQTRAALEQSLEQHFVSDVPVGLFLSGGIDSTALAALARANGHENLKTFCISFEDPEYDEGGLAKRTAQHFGTQHTDWRMTADDGASLIDRFLNAMDQPSNDGFNTYCVSKLAHEHGMKVVLSGLGGDELFGGYPSFQQVPHLVRLFRGASLIPGRARIGSALAGYRGSNRIRRVGEFLEGDGSVASAWSAMRGFFTSRETATLVRWIAGGNQAESGTLETPEDNSTAEAQADQISRCELTRYMRNQLLRDSDVMSMAWGLELRVPFVDSSLVDSMTRIDWRLRLRQSKKLLVEAVPEIPHWITNQPKRGFRFPFDRWARVSWQPVVDEIQRLSPVPCESWHRTWSLFLVRQFIRQNRILAEGDSTASDMTVCPFQGDT